MISSGRNLFVALLFFSLCLFLGFNHAHPWIILVDQKVYHVASSLSSALSTLPWLQLHRVISFLGDTFFLLPLSAMTIAMTLFFQKARPWQGLWLAASYGMVQLVNFTLKNIFDRVRPISLLDGYQMLTYAYPSGHSSGSVVFWGMVYLVFFEATRYRKKAVMVLGSLVLAIGLSRIFLGVHWLSDVVGGFLLGFSVLFLVKVIKKRFFRE